MKHYERRAALGFAAGLVAIAGAAVALPPVLAQRPESTVITVDPTKEGWVSTEIVLTEGQTATLTASGTAGWEPGQNWGPAGAGATYCPLALPEAPVGALLARVGDGIPVVLSARTGLSGPGTVQVLYNDCPGQYFDNIGSFSLAVALPAPPPVPTAAPVVVATEAPVAAATVQPVVVATVEPVAAATVEPVSEVAPAPAAGGGRRLPVLPLAGLLVLAAVGIAGWRLRRTVTGLFAARARFAESARLESSAWLAPARLRLLQGDRRPKRVLTIGGPDADIDFGVQGIWARLTPTSDGGVRIEQAKDAGRMLVDGLPVVMARSLTDGAHVFMGTREFVFRQDRTSSFAGPTGRSRNDMLSRPDPRAAAFAGEAPPGRDVA